MLPIPPRQVIEKLREFQREVRAAAVRARDATDMHQVSRHTAADTIYRIDAAIDPIAEQFFANWSASVPLVLIAEGLAEEDGREGVRVLPRGSREEDALIRVLLDPIDGTRGLMYDKRSGWSLAGVAPNRGDATRIRDIEAAVMTELPTSKMHQADVLWAIKGEGAVGQREWLDGSAQPQPLLLRPSRAQNIDHGFAMISNFFPGTKVLASSLMEQIAAALLPAADSSQPLVFEDQYICTGGQFYELIVGHDRFNADLRSAFYAARRMRGMCPHPYDCATSLIASEAGVILTDEHGGPLEGPLDVTTGLSWVGYANEALRRKIEPVLLKFLADQSS